MTWNGAASALASTALLLGALPLIAAHGDDGAMETSHGSTEANQGPEHTMANYFRHPEFWGWQLAHTGLMVLSWFILMPLAIFLSVARSRYHLPAQVLFHLVNGLGILAGVVYNRSTPDLYVNNSHHPLGWVVVALTIAWTLISVYVACGEHWSRKRASIGPELSFASLNMGQYDPISRNYDELSSRDSRDSGQGTERNSASLYGSRQNSSEQIHRKPEVPGHDLDFDDDDQEEQLDSRGFLGQTSVDRFLSRSVDKISSQRAILILLAAQVFLEKFLLLLGSAALLSGFIVSGGLFRDRQIFSGLAHYIKGGIFFWYGLLTLGRWMGAFTEFGWAWNVRPQQPCVTKWKTRVPSAEFTESFIIWLYGASNVFLEHLNSKGGEWSPSDLEHLSITVLFFGGGLLGMLIESKWARELLNTTVLDQKKNCDEVINTSRYPLFQKSKEEQWQEPLTYHVSLNPMPALTIMLLGMMMGAHHQSSMVSTMMHAQWGGLFSAFAVARGVTYLVLYLKPPTSHFPSRPPSEIVAAFCLTGGGLMFMNSSADTVWAIESNGLDAMTIFTITMGFTGIILAWEVVLFALKGWAVRKERGAMGRTLA